VIELFIVNATGIPLNTTNSYILENSETLLQAKEVMSKPTMNLAKFLAPSIVIPEFTSTY